MNKNLLSVLRYTAVVVLVAGLFVISGCDKDDPGPIVFNGTLLDFIGVKGSNDLYTPATDFKQSATVSADLALDSLVKYLTIYPDLNALLSSTTDYTLFAPSNTAFISLTALPGLSNINLINPDLIKGVLSYHFVAGKKMKSELTAGVKLATLYTDIASSTVQEIEVNSDLTLKTGSQNTAIEIVAGGEDKLSTNGVVHIVETVLIPPSVGATLTPLLGTVAASVLLGKDFTYLAYMIGFADNGVATASKVSSILASPIGTANPNGITVFAPPNAVFEGAYKQATGTTATPTAAQVQGFITTAWTGGGAGTAAVTLKNHIVAGRYVVTATTGATTITNGGSIPSLAGKNLTTLTGTPVNAQTNPFGVVITSPSTPVSQAPIVKKDLAASAGIGNGVLQVVAGILKPQ